MMGTSRTFFFSFLLYEWLIFFPYFCFSPSGFHHLHRRHHNKIGRELCSALRIYVCAFGDSEKKTVNCTLVLVESYAGFHVKTKHCELWESGLCATDWERQNCVTKHGNLQISVFQYGIHTSKQADMLLRNWNWEGDVTHRVGHLRLLHLWLLKSETQDWFPHLYSSAVDSWHRHTSCIERLSFGLQSKHALWCK